MAFAPAESAGIYQLRCCGGRCERAKWSERVVSGGGKSPCWVIRGCIPAARELCRAYQDQSRPCWEQHTLCKELFDIDSCFACKVYRLYGKEQGPDEEIGAGGSQ